MTLQRPGSVMSTGSRLSLYSTTSSVARTGTLRSTRSRTGTRSQQTSTPGWWGKPIVRTAGYTDLTTAALHAGWFTIFLSFWTFCFSVFDIYCLEEASPGSVHTGYYWMSYEFVYVGNHHIRNLLLLASLVSLAASIPLFITSCFLLNAMRLENQTGFVAWLITMTVFILWKNVQLCYSTVVNDMIFGYNLFTFFSWMIFNVVNIGSLVVVYSYYQELRSLDHLETITRQKLDISSRAGSIYGSRVGSIYGSRVGTPLDTINRQYFRGSEATGIYSATPAYVEGDNKSLYTSTPREHIYDSLQRPQEQIYSTVIH